MTDLMSNGKRSRMTVDMALLIHNNFTFLSIKEHAEKESDSEHSRQ